MTGLQTNDELKALKKISHAIIWVLSQQLPEGAGENHEKPQ
jgi:hypothetical protein